MSGRNFCENGNFGSGEVLLGISGNRNFCWMQLFSRGYYQLFPKFGRFADCWFGWILGHLSGVSTWLVVQEGRRAEGVVGEVS